MKLKELIQTLSVLRVEGSTEISIKGVSANSKNISPGHLFIARRGKTFDGTLFLPEARRSGAVAVVSDFYNPAARDMTQVIVSNVKEAEALLAKAFYRHPSNELMTVGVTGTNGKTTTTFYLKNLLEMMGIPCGLIGTVENCIGGKVYHSTHTTPDVVSNHRFLREMINEGCLAAVMEVTSHALDQERVAHLDFNAAIFTNLSQDHLDYHRTMEEYAAAKSKLFTSLTPAASAIVNSDCIYSEAMVRHCRASIFRYGIIKEADLSAQILQSDATGSEVLFKWRGEKIAAFLPVVGKYNIYNAMGAMLVPLAKGSLLSEIVPLLESLPQVPGRLERVENKAGFSIFVDFAHTPDALEKVIETLRPLTEKRLITLFGCGGDRDSLKRPLMGRAASSSDYLIVTSDNPRSENPETICREIEDGILNCPYRVIIDRRAAIHFALNMLQKGDLLLIAGRGHESVQMVGKQSLPFHDPSVAAEICQELFL